MSLKSHRHVFIKPSKWFTEDIEMIFFLSQQIAEEISREMGLTIANDVRKQKQHQEAYADPTR
jgi:hypothetical protein